MRASDVWLLFFIRNITCRNGLYNNNFRHKDNSEAYTYIERLQI